MCASAEFVQDKDHRKFFDVSRKVGPQIATALMERGVIGRPCHRATSAALRRRSA